MAAITTAISAYQIHEIEPVWLDHVHELASETGDLLFALVNLARHVDANPEMALRGANAKFERRFAYIERALETVRLRDRADQKMATPIPDSDEPISSLAKLYQSVIASAVQTITDMKKSFGRGKNETNIRLSSLS